MGNCTARPLVHEQSEERAVVGKRHRQRRSSLGRFADFLSPQSSAIRDAVSEKLPTAANRGSQEVINLVEGPGYLEPAVWCAGLDVPVVKARATALEKAIDALLNPLLSSLEELLDGGAAKLGKGQHCYWHTASLKEVLYLLPTAAKMHSGVGLTSLSHAFGSMVKVVHALSQAALDAELPVPPEIFHVASLNRLLNIVGTLVTRQIKPEPAEVGQKRWQAWEAIKRSLSLEEEKVLVALSARSKALLLWMQGGVAGRQIAAFQVRREHAFMDAFQQAQASELLQTTVGGCIIEATFVDALGSTPGSTEPGVGHGPRREFFLLAGQSMLEQPQESAQASGRRSLPALAQPLFLYNRWAARYWFNTRIEDTNELRAEYAFAGWLLGQSFCNCTSMGAAFPELLFSKLLLGPSFKATLEVLQEFDVEAAAAVRGAATLRDADWRELLAQEGLDPSLKRRSYIKHAVHRLLVTDVQWQFAAFAQGFFTAVDFKALLRWSLTPADMEEWAAGEPLGSDFLIQDVFRIVFDPQMQTISPKLGSAVVQVVNGWQMDMKVRFIRFVTGASRPCLPQMEVLRMAMPFTARPQQAWPHVLAMLPQAHTCENVLELPDYWSALANSDLVVQTLQDPSRTLDLDAELHHLLQHRLSLAVMHCSTYEIAGGPSTGVADMLLEQHDQAGMDAADNKASSTQAAELHIIADAATSRQEEAMPATPVQKQAPASHYVEITPSPQPRPSDRSSSRVTHKDSRFANGTPGKVPTGTSKAPGQKATAAHKPASRTVARTKQTTAVFPDDKLGQPQQSGSPLSPEDSIPAVRKVPGKDSAVARRTR